MPAITSRRHRLVQRYRSLARRSPDHHELLLEGPHIVREAVEAGRQVLHAAFTHTALARDEGRALWTMLGDRGTPRSEVSEEVMRAMSPVKTPWGLVAIAERPAWTVPDLLSRAPQLVVIAADVQDPGNLGAMIRAAEAGGATGLVAAGASADPFGWRALRGSMGSGLRLPVARAATLEVLPAARRHGVRVIAAGPRQGTSLYSLDLTGPVAFLLGGEGPGLSEDVLSAADAVVTIPMAVPVESLNVAIATALLVYEARRQRGDPRVKRDQPRVKGTSDVTSG